MKKLALILAFFALAGIASAQKTNKLVTTKQQPKDTSAKQTWYLLGYKEDFQLLYQSLTDPGNVTPNQVKALANWVVRAQIIAADTTKKVEPK